MWQRSESNLLYHFEYNGGGYDLLITDLCRVYREKASSSRISAKGDKLNCPFSLEKPNQIEIFCRNIAESLPRDASFNLDQKTGFVKAKVSEVEWSWEFKLVEVNSKDALKILGDLTGDLWHVVDQIAELLNSRNEVINKKDLVIESLLESGRRGVEYRAPSFLQEYTKPARFPEVSPADLMKLH